MWCWISQSRDECHFILTWNQAELSCMCKYTSVKHAFWARKMFVAAVVSREIRCSRTPYIMYAEANIKFMEHTISVMAVMTLLPSFSMILPRRHGLCKAQHFGMCTIFLTMLASAIQIEWHQEEGKLIHSKPKIRSCAAKSMGSYLLGPKPQQ